MGKKFCSLCASDKTEAVIVLEDYGYGLPGQFPLVRCLECGLLYISPRPTVEEMGRYYPVNYAPYKTAIDDESWALMRWVRRRNIRKYRRVVERYTTVPLKKILDIGCSTGIFLDEMRSAGWCVEGIELSAAAVQYANKRFDLDIIEGRLIDVYEQIDAGSISAATLWDVLEHTYDPFKTLAILNTILSKDGIIVLTIPHWESLDRKVFANYWIGYDAPRHLYVFTREVIRTLLQKSGFDIVDMHCAFGGYYTLLPSIKNLANSHIKNEKIRRLLYQLLSVPGMRFLTLPFDAVMDTLGLGNKLLVVARKAK
jgi:SAM-dependent methyltransferase